MERGRIGDVADAANAAATVGMAFKVGWGCFDVDDDDGACGGKMDGLDV